MNYATIVDSVIEEHKSSPIDMLGIGDMLGEYKYLKNLRESYIRTVSDVDRYMGNGRESKHCLEIGAFLGAVSISLRKLGYRVSALDIPEFHKSANLRELYRRNDVDFGGLNLRSSKLPFESNTFDAVVICEVIEHLNFNPLPTLLEINRVLKLGGYLYIGMPNQASLKNRIRLLKGHSVHNPIQDFFQQLDRSDNMIVGLHWREYTMPEAIDLIGRMGFKTLESYYFMGSEYNSKFPKSIIKKLIYSHAALKPFQVVIGQKESTPSFDFWQTEANS